MSRRCAASPPGCRRRPLLTRLRQGQCRWCQGPRFAGRCRWRGRGGRAFQASASCRHFQYALL